MSPAPTPSDAERPVFVLSATWRCGSTLLQRLLSSSDQLFVWGETAGMLHRLRAVAVPPAHFQATQERQREDFEKNGIAAWIPNLAPPADAAAHAERAYLTTYYGAATEQLGRRRWGLKEVRYGAEDARLLLELFPHGRLLFLLRHPVDVLSSLARLRWSETDAHPEPAARAWTRHTAEMLAMDDDRCLVVRHEDVVADTDTTLARIGAHVGIDVSTLDRSIVETPLGGAPGEPAPDPIVIALARDEELRRVATAAGYDVAGHPLVAGAGTTMRVKAAWMRHRLGSGDA